MLLPTGIYVQPAHPAFVQLHQPSQPPLFSAASQQIQQQPVVKQQYLVQQPVSVGHQTTTSFIPQPPPSFVYVEQDDG